MNFEDGNPRVVLETDAGSVANETGPEEMSQYNEKYLYLGFGIVILLVITIFVVLLK